MDNKDNGMMTKIWGPPGWLFLHSISFGYPYLIDKNNKEDLRKRDEYKNFFLYIGKVFPCRYCRESYEEFIKEIPIDHFLSSREDLCYWLYIIHNKVNNKLGVPKCDIPTFDDIQLKYETFRAKCQKTTNKERDNNLKKKCKRDLSSNGCIIPKDGVLKKCEINIITSNSKKSINITIINIILFILIIIVINTAIFIYILN